jgi:hypothetical protein
MELDPRHHRVYALPVRRLSVLLVAAILAAYLAPAVAGVLVCLDGKASDCCPKPAEDRPVVTPGCDCCVTVDALPRNVGASLSKGLLEAVAEPARFRSAVAPSVVRIDHATVESEPDVRLAALRTVILLV